MNATSNQKSKAIKKYEATIAFMKKHPAYHATLHGLGGIGVGILIMYLFDLQHPLIWVSVLLTISVLGHLYAAI